MRFILLMLLAMLSNVAAAEWMSVSGNSTYDNYVDPDNIRRSGDIVQMWDMKDFKSVWTSPGGQRILSGKTEAEYDCKGERKRTLFFTWYSGNMGAGSVVYSDDGVPGNWESFVPGSVGAALWKIACGKQ